MRSRSPGMRSRECSVSDETRDSRVLNQWVGPRRRFASADLIWRGKKKKITPANARQQRSSGAVAPIIRVPIWSNVPALRPIFQTSFAREQQKNGGQTGTRGTGCQLRGLPCLSVRTHTNTRSMGWSQTNIFPTYLPHPKDHLQPAVIHSRK